MLIWLKELREQKNKSQTTVAKECNISRQYYSFIENKKRRPSPQVAQRITAVLGVPDAWPDLLRDKI